MGLFHRYIADNGNPSSLASRLRRKRFAFFSALLDVEPKPSRILDVGGTIGFWQSMRAIRPGLEITLLNRRPPAQPLPSGFYAAIGDACEMTDFGDAEFDLVFSNSVIEHVGTIEDQLHMACEVRRVGKRYFVQTPNRFFPIEAHFLLPWFQFYPRPLQLELTRRFDLGWHPKQPDRERASARLDELRLLDATEMQRLFPDARIHRERIAGLTKSLIAIGPT